MIGRAEWGAVYGQGFPTDGPKTLVVVHHDGHTRSLPGMTVQQEAAIMRMIESYHVNGEKGVPGLTRTNPRIGYSFVVMQTGRIYEGCGWDRVGAHTANYNSSAYGVFFPLNGAKDKPTPAAVAAFHQLRAEGLRLNNLSRNHLVKGHQDFNKPSCPGRLVYDAVVLDVQPMPGAGPTKKEIIAAHPTLRQGKGGKFATAAEYEAVKFLQQQLVMPAEYRTGYFGAVTYAAVLNFQKRHGLLPDGIVGPKTWAFLKPLP